MSLFKTSVDIAAASTATVLAPWVVAAPDSHTIRVEVSPFVLDESNFANNAASRAVVLGAVLGVEPSAPATHPIQFAPPRPNPARGGVVFEFELPRIASASLRIFDVFGREVMEWRWASLSPGSHQVSWDGGGASGVQMPAGLYLCRLQVEGEQFHHRLILRR